MAPVYTTRFAETAGVNVAYTCPAGYRAVLKCITAFNYGSSAAEGWSVWGSGSLGPFLGGWLPYDAASQPPPLTILNLTYAFDAGEGITLVCAADVRLTASGFLLTLP